MTETKTPVVMTGVDADFCLCMSLAANMDAAGFSDQMQRKNTLIFLTTNKRM